MTPLSSSMTGRIGGSLPCRRGASGAGGSAGEWPLQRAREVLSTSAVIGVSAHASSHLAMEAGEQGADYVAFGAFFPTTSKSPENWQNGAHLKLSWWRVEPVCNPALCRHRRHAAGKPRAVSAGRRGLQSLPSTASGSHTAGPKAAVAAYNEAIEAALNNPDT